MKTTIEICPCIMCATSIAVSSAARDKGVHAANLGKPCFLALSTGYATDSQAMPQIVIPYCSQMLGAQSCTHCQVAFRYVCSQAELQWSSSYPSKAKRLTEEHRCSRSEITNHRHHHHHHHFTTHQQDQRKQRPKHTHTHSSHLQTKKW